MKNKRRILIFAVLAVLICTAGVVTAIILNNQNGIYCIDGSLYKKGAELDEQTLVANIDVLNAVRADYFPDADVYYALIPDKNFFSDKATLDYDRIAEIVDSEFFAVNSISLFESLTAESYFYTDGYWRQECLQAVVNRLGAALGFEIDLEDFSLLDYTGYLGGYSHLTSKKHGDDILFTLINLDTRSAEVCDMLTGQYVNIYATDLFEGDTPYSIYLGGSRALTDIINPEVETGKRLIVFGDDFSYPLVPLLLPAYSEIVLIDLRLISLEDLSGYVEFEGAEVLYLYNTAGLCGENFK